MFGFLKRNKSAHPGVILCQEAIALLLAIWRDDIFDSTPRSEYLASVFSETRRDEKSVLGELFCLRYFAGRFGVALGIRDLEKSRAIADRMEVLQQAMTSEIPPGKAEASAERTNRFIVGQLRDFRRSDPARSDSVERTRAYVPAYSQLHARFDEYNKLMVEALPDAQKGLEAVAARFCTLVDNPRSKPVHAGAFFYLSAWMNTLRDAVAG
jgi:hypothetical protein